jgi:hypothetical protein
MGQRIKFATGAATNIAAGVGTAKKISGAIASNIVIKNSNNSLASPRLLRQPKATTDNTRSPSPLEDFIHSVLEPSDITSPLDSLLVRLRESNIFRCSYTIYTILYYNNSCFASAWAFNSYNINIIKYILVKARLWR